MSVAERRASITMIGDRQEQTAGDHSLNVQGRDITIGVSYSEARQIAMDVFEANFYRLANVAADTARFRAEELLDAYLATARKEEAETIPEADNPDLQYALFTAQREYARTGDKDLGELLVQLLVDRTKETERGLLQIVLNESLSVAPKLTVDQLDVLSIVFLLRYTRYRRFSSLMDFESYLDRLILPFSASLPRKRSAYQHLEFASCGTISIGEISIEEILHRNYPALFAKGFTREEAEAAGLFPTNAGPVLMRCLHDPLRLQANRMDDDEITARCGEQNISDDVCSKLKELHNNHLMSHAEIKEFVLRVRPAMSSLFDVWQSTELRHLNLTSVGIAIGHANIRRRTGEAFDLSIWI